MARIAGGGGAVRETGEIIGYLAGWIAKGAAFGLGFWLVGALLQ